MECEVEGGMCVGVESANADSSHNIDVLSVLDKEKCDALSNSPDDIGQLGRCDVPLDVLDVRVGLAVSHLDGHRVCGATRLAAVRTRRRSSRWRVLSGWSGMGESEEWKGLWLTIVLYRCSWRGFVSRVGCFHCRTALLLFLDLHDVVVVGLFGGERLEEGGGMCVFYIFVWMDIEVLCLALFNIRKNRWEVRYI